MDPEQAKFEYLARLRAEICQQTRLDWASRESFVAEIEHHITYLEENLWAAKDRSTAQKRAVSLMDPPGLLAEALGRADELARKSAPIHRWIVIAKNWAEWLQLPAQLAWAAIICLCSMVAAMFLLAVVPASMQEFWIVPAIALTVMGLTWMAGSFSGAATARTLAPRQLMWAIVFAIGANIATYVAEYVSSPDTSIALAAAHVAFALIIAVFASISLAAIYFPEKPARKRFFKLAFVTISTGYLIFSQVIVWTGGHKPQVLFCIYIIFGVITLRAVRNYLNMTMANPAHRPSYP